MKSLLFISLTTLFLFSGCATKEETIPVEEKVEVVVPQQDSIKTNTKNMEAVTFNDIDGFYRDDLNHDLDVFKKDCKKIVKRFNLLSFFSIILDRKFGWYNAG